ncbi:MAG: hypothetical protein GY841_14865, partial [FCB group bacterium]|nr:hypothetical protein [FCB group bacterium]
KDKSSTNSGRGSSNSSAENNNEDDTRTVLLFTHRGADHISKARAHKGNIARAAGWDGLFVVNKENSSSLYWGKYKSRSKLAEKNLKKAKNFVSPSTGVRLYERAIIVPLPGKDLGPEKWNLKNAPSNAVYSVQVGVYYDIPARGYFGRKKEAVEVCRKLRQRGEEGYFYHGLKRSGVYIGAFPASSVSMQRTHVKHPRTGHKSYKDNQVVNDPRMKRILKDYPELVICGNTETIDVYDHKTKTVKKSTRTSSPVYIPGRGKASP